MLTSKDFKKAADLVLMYKTAKMDTTKFDPCAITTVLLARIFAESNPKFDCAEFFKACGYEP